MAQTKQFPNAGELIVGEGWRENTKIHTCKCKLCGQLVRKGSWSYQCTKCLQHVCSICLGLHDDRTSTTLARARDHVTTGCWTCLYRSGINPRFLALAAKRLKKKHEGKILQAITTAKNGTVAQMAAPADPKIAENVGVADMVQPSGIDRRGDCCSRSQRAFADAEVGKCDRGMQEAKGEESLKDLKIDSGAGTPAISSELSSDGDNEQSIPLAASLSSPTTLSLDHTVIVGAGIVGLSIAYALRREAIALGSNRQVTVIEVRNGPCELASNHSNGLLSTIGLPEHLMNLAQSAKEAWRLMFTQSSATEESGFDQSTLWRVVRSGTTQRLQRPAWMKDGEDLPVFDDAQSIGRIDPKSYATWLYKQCKMLGVVFKFRNDIASVSFTKDQRLNHVHIQDLSAAASPVNELACTNLVLATGPFTTQILRGLLPKHTLRLQNKVQTSHWFSISAPVHAALEETCLRFFDAAENEPKLDNEITMRTSLVDNTITVSGWASRIKNEHIASLDAIDPGHGKTRELRRLMAQYLNRDGVDVRDRAHVVATGRSEVSVANGDAPIIDSIPASAIGLHGGQESVEGRSSGVWLCYGFGRHGTLLAPTAADLLVSRMFGRGCAVDAFRFPLHENLKRKERDEGK